MRRDSLHLWNYKSRDASRDEQCRGSGRVPERLPLEASLFFLRRQASSDRRVPPRVLGVEVTDVEWPDTKTRSQQRRHAGSPPPLLPNARAAATAVSVRACAEPCLRPRPRVDPAFGGAAPVARIPPLFPQEPESQ